MMRKYILMIFALLAIKCDTQAAYTVVDGKLVNCTDEGQLTGQQIEDSTSPQWLFRKGIGLMKAGNWEEGVSTFYEVSSQFPDAELGQVAFYYLGTCYYQLNEFDLANDAFSSYLKGQKNQDYFESAVEYKLAIANRFADGERRRLYGIRYIPKFLPALDEALQIYDEVSATLPCHELAVMALYSKAALLWDMERYEDSVETYQQIIRRFPKHELAPESYLAISCIYLEQCDDEINNSDLLAFAQINLRKFEHDFPREERIEAVENNFAAMEERYAQSLYETGQFYERKAIPKASIIYYQNTLDRFPNSQTAKWCQKRIQFLKGESV